MRRGGAGGGPSPVRRESGAARPSPARAPPVPAAKSCVAALRLGAAAMVRPGGRPGLVPSHGGRAGGWAPRPCGGCPARFGRRRRCGVPG